MYPYGSKQDAMVLMEASTGASIEESQPDPDSAPLRCDWSLMILLPLLAERGRGHA